MGGLGIHSAPPAQDTFPSVASIKGRKETQNSEWPRRHRGVGVGTEQNSIFARALRWSHQALLERVLGSYHPCLGASAAASHLHGSLGITGQGSKASSA